jgi:hypothetical protein
MSSQTFIILQGLLAFGAPLTLAVIELVKLRRKTPAPVGGGDPLATAEPSNVTPFPSRTPLPTEPEALPELQRAA